MPISFVPQNIFNLAKKGLMVTGTISGGEVKTGMTIIIGRETGLITKIEQHKGNPTIGVLITGLQLDSLQGKIGQQLTITG